MKIFQKVKTELTPHQVIVHLSTSGKELKSDLQKLSALSSVLHFLQ